MHRTYTMTFVSPSPPLRRLDFVTSSRVTEHGLSTHRLHGGYQRRNVNPDHRAFSRPALDLQIEIGSIQHMQPLAHVAQPDALHVNVRHLLFGDAHAVVFNFNMQPS